MSNNEAKELIVETGAVDVFGIKKEIFEQSIDYCKKIVSESHRLGRDWAPNLAEQLYRQRRSYLTELIGNTGRYRFTPKSSYDAVEEAKPLINTVVDELVKEYNMTPLSSPEEAVVRARYDAMILLKETLTTQDYLSNKVPQHLIGEAKNEKGKPFMTSPKLSKWLTKIAGESSDLVAWYTNRCPKGEAVLGERSEYELVMSILPHDILGMSYYAPYNFGGDRWIDGYNYTSCMDPVQNTSGSNLDNLPPNMWDETLAVCYLRKVDDSDFTSHSRYRTGEEIFNARMLVRVFKVKGQHFIIGHRVYATTRDEFKLIVNAMELEFPNFVHADTLENMSGDKRRFAYYHTHLDRSAPDIRITNDGEQSGNKTAYYPYNDNSGTISFDAAGVKVHLPQSFLTKHNIKATTDDSGEDSDTPTATAQAVAQPGMVVAQQVPVEPVAPVQGQAQPAWVDEQF